VSGSFSRSTVPALVSGPSRVGFAQVSLSPVALFFLCVIPLRGSLDPLHMHRFFSGDLLAPVPLSALTIAPPQNHNPGDI